MSSIADLYESSKNALNKKISLSPPFADIEDWVSQNLNVTPLNITYEVNFRRLNLVFRDAKYLEKFTLESKRQFKTVLLSTVHYQNILKKYPEYANEHLYLRAIHFNHLAIDYISSTSDLATLQKELDLDALWKIHKRGTLSCIFFFYGESEAQKFKTEENKQFLIDRYFSFLKSKDEFNLLEKEKVFILIDTKENLTLNYQGSMQFYLRDH